MMSSTKKPPRFVPTLTDVVQMPEGGPATTPAIRSAGLKEAVTTEPIVATNVADALPRVAATSADESSASGEMMGVPYGFEEYVVHRVMQRVDLVLDQRLREAIALVVQEQTRSMVPRLREEVESVVRHAVYEAVAEELAGERSGH